MKNKEQKEYLFHEVELEPRFSEVDSMGIVWHGHYLKYFEDAREALGTKFNMGYMDVYDNEYLIPIVHSEIDYKKPIRYQERIKVKIWLIKSQAAKIIYDFEIFNLTQNEIVCTGQTIQAFTDLEGRLQLIYPEFYSNWINSQDWKK